MGVHSSWYHPPHPVQDTIPPSCVWHLQTISIFPVLFFCWLFCFTVLHGKGFISSSFKHLSRCTLITECLKHPSRPVIASYKGQYRGILYISARGYVAGYLTRNANIVPRTRFTRESCTWVQYSLGNLVWGYNNSGIPDSQ